MPPVMVPPAGPLPTLPPFPPVFGGGLAGRGIVMPPPAGNKLHLANGTMLPLGAGASACSSYTGTAAAELLQMGYGWGQQQQQMAAKVDRQSELMEEMMNRLNILQMPSRPTCTCGSPPPHIYMYMYISCISAGGILLNCQEASSLFVKMHPP